MRLAFAAVPVPCLAYVMIHAPSADRQWAEGGCHLTGGGGTVTGATGVVRLGGCMQAESPIHRPTETLLLIRMDGVGLPTMTSSSPAGCGIPGVWDVRGSAGNACVPAERQRNICRQTHVPIQIPRRALTPRSARLRLGNESGHQR